MLFNSYIFLFVFLPVVYLGYILIVKLQRKTLLTFWLLVASLVFYGYWELDYVLLILVSIVVNYVLAFYIKNSIRFKKYILISALIFNLGLLGYFKYTNMLVATLDNLFSAHMQGFDIILPIAISFFTFEQIAYLVDTYRNGDYSYNFLDYSLFVCFFPRLISGPIIRHNEVLTQIANNCMQKVSASNFSVGLSLFAFGLFKKIIFADQLSNISTPVFHQSLLSSHIPMVQAWVGVLAFTFQIYFDFSSYSDMAIGIAKMFNITLPINFNSPYQAINVSDFWRRWNITLSRFLRDYLYVPLGGNRKGELRRNYNLIITMLLGGLWHGASWTFVLWGGLHGLYLVFYHQWIRCFSWRPNKRLAQAITFFCVVMAWVPFRAKTFQSALNLYHAMFSFHAINSFSWHKLLLILFALLWVIALPNVMQVFKYYQPVLESAKLMPSRLLVWYPSRYWLMICVAVLLFALLSMGVSKSFIYFDF